MSIFMLLSLSDKSVALIIWLDSIRATTLIKCVTSSYDPSNHLTFEFV